MPIRFDDKRRDRHRRRRRPGPRLCARTRAARREGRGQRSRRRSRDGTGHSDAALKVVEEIEAAGGEAMSNGGSVTEYDQMVEMVAQGQGEVGRRPHPDQQRRRAARQELRQDGAGRFRVRRRRPPDRLGQRHQGGVGDDARAELRPHPDDRVVDRAVRQFRPGQLRRRQARPRRPDQDALPRGREEQHPRQHDRPDRGHADDRGPVPRPRRSRPFAPEKVVARRAVSCVSEDAPTNEIVGAGAGVFQAALRHADAGHAAAGRRPVARGRRGALGRDHRPHRRDRARVGRRAGDDDRARSCRAELYLP